MVETIGVTFPQRFASAKSAGHLARSPQLGAPDLPNDVTDMFLRQVKRIQHRTEEAVTLYRITRAEGTDAPIARLRDITLAQTQEGTRDQRLFANEAAIMDALSDTEHWMN